MFKRCVPVSFLVIIFCSLALHTQCSPETISQSSVSISDLSDEILLHILSYVPSYDLVLSVSRVCRKLQTVCQDKSLISHIELRKEYRVSTETMFVEFSTFHDLIICLFKFNTGLLFFLHLVGI